MKKVILAAFVLLSLPVLANQVISLGDGMTIDSFSKQGDEVLLSVKSLNIDGVMIEKNIAYEITKWGIKCAEKEYIWYGQEEYGADNQLISNYEVKFRKWNKIDNDEPSKFPQILYDKVCK